MYKFLVCLLLLFSGQSYATCQLDIYANKNSKPKIYLKDGHANGIIKEMLDYVSQDINCTFNYHLSNWARAYKSMLDEKGAIIGLSKTSQRLQLIDYSNVIYIEKLVLVTHSENVFNYTTLNDLKGKTVGYSRGARISDEFEQAVENGLYTAPWDEDSGQRSDRHGYIYGRL